MEINRFIEPTTLLINVISGTSLLVGLPWCDATEYLIDASV